jgi:short-subunit dehydrogenase
MMDEFFELLPMDNLDEVSIHAVVTGIMEKEGRIDLVVCNAGKTVFGAVENTPSIEGLQQLDVNFMGVARLISAVLPSMRRNRSGTILVIGSLAGRTGIPFSAYYSASKFALEGYIESLRLELAHLGIRIAMIDPGSVRTGFESTLALFPGGSEDGYAKDYSKVLRTIVDREREGINPVVIARLVHRLMGRKKLRTRYYVGLIHQRLGLLLKFILPARMYEYILLTYFGITKTSEE